MGKRMLILLFDFMMNNMAKQEIWINVNKWTLIVRTCRRNIKSGWCFSGMKINVSLCMNWMPFNDEMPMYKKTPYKTGIGILFNTLDWNTELPMSMNTTRQVSRCSITPRNLGFSPGAADSDSFLRLITWFKDKTVAATNHGMPNREFIPIVMATMSKSKW